MCIRDRLIPNAELGHLEIDGHDAETRAAASIREREKLSYACLLYTSDAADERSSVDLGGRRLIQKKTKKRKKKEITKKKKTNTHDYTTITSKTRNINNKQTDDHQ